MDSHAPCLCLVACCTLSATGHGRLAAEVVGGHPRIAASGAARPSSAGVVIVSVPAHRPRRSGMVARGRSPPRRAVARRGGGRIGRVCLGWLLRASSPRARAALVHVWVALAYPVLLLRCDVTRAGSEGPAQLPRRTRPLLSCVELHHVAAGGHPRSPIGSWNITSWWTRRLLAAALGRLIHVRVSLRGDGRCCPPELSIWHEAVRSRTDYASAPAALARRAASHLRGRGVARERWRRL